MNTGKCSLDLLHQGPTGSVSFCNECQHIHLEIKNLLAIVSEESFRLIIDDLKTRLQAIEDNQQEEKKVLIKLSNNHLYLKLSTEEFISTFELFEISVHFLAAKKILLL